MYGIYYLLIVCMLAVLIMFKNQIDKYLVRAGTLRIYLDSLFGFLVWGHLCCSLDVNRVAILLKLQATIKKDCPPWLEVNVEKL